MDFYLLEYLLTVDKDKLLINFLIKNTWVTSLVVKNHKEYFCNTNLKAGFHWMLREKPQFKNEFYLN